MNTIAVIVAGGRGERFGWEAPKQFALLGGVPLIVRSVRPFEKSILIESIVVVARPGDENRVREVLPPAEFTKVTSIVSGGLKRQDSVWNGVEAALDRRPDYLAIHDAARPLVTTELIEKVVRGAMLHRAAIPALRARETVKRADGAGCIVETIPRDSVYLAQTPQVFEASLLREAFSLARAEGFSATDDASLVEHFGIAVHIVEGDPRNLKVTTPGDLLVAELLLGQNPVR